MSEREATASPFVPRQSFEEDGNCTILEPLRQLAMPESGVSAMSQTTDVLTLTVMISMMTVPLQCW